MPYQFNIRPPAILNIKGLTHKSQAISDSSATLRTVRVPAAAVKANLAMRDKILISVWQPRCTGDSPKTNERDSIQKTEAEPPNDRR